MADDHPLYREGVLRAIGSRAELELVGQAADGREALAEIARLRPQVALLDVRMPGLAGPQVLAAVKRERFATRVILLSAHVESESVYEAVAAGASGYLSKDADANQIADAIAAVARGETVLAPQVQSLLATAIREQPGLDRAGLLSERERQVLQRIAAGLSTPQMATDLHLSPATVKGHLRTLYEKLGVTERAAAVAEAMRRGLLE